MNKRCDHFLEYTEECESCRRCQICHESGGVRLFERQDVVYIKVKPTAHELVEAILQHVGDDPTREGLLDTPARVVRMWSEIFQGYHQNPEQLLQRQFVDERHQEMIIVRDIVFYSHCEHHMVPFFGKAQVGYIPGAAIAGISKFARVVECFARRLQIQERLTSQIADTIDKVLVPKGVIVVIEAQHMCMQMRGVKSPCANTTTIVTRGVFKDDGEKRSEFLNLIGRSI